MCEEALVAAAKQGQAEASPHCANLTREGLSGMRIASPEIMKTQRMPSKMPF